MRVLLRHFVSIGALLLVSLPFSRASIVTAATESTPRISVLEQPFLVTSSTRGRFVFQLPEGIATRNTTLDVRVHRRLASRTSFQSIANEEVEAAVIDTFSVPVRQLSLLDNQGYLVTIPFSSSAKSASSLTVPFEGVYPVSLVLRRKPADPPLAKALTFIHKRDTDSKVPKVASTVGRASCTNNLHTTRWHTYHHRHSACRGSRVHFIYFVVQLFTDDFCTT